MGLRLLGPPDLVVGGRSVDVGGPRTRTVMAVLALNANRATSIDRLIDAVWEDAPPATARSQIQICVSTLRKIFDRAGLTWQIRSRHHGYLLEVPPAELDVEEFARLVTLAHSQAGAGRREEAAATFRDALALWRGPALAGISGRDVRGEVARLEEHRLAALEERIRLDLELGRHRELSGELRALVEQHPLRERLHGLLMLALYRSDRQADALAAYRAARDRLAEEIGVEPGAGLRDLHRRILDSDPVLSAPPSSKPAEPLTPEPRPIQPAPDPLAATWTPPRQLPASLTDFTGREEQLETIRQALSPGAGSPVSYALPVVGIFGPGGVGKTSLAIRAAHELAPTYPDGQLYADLRIAIDETPSRLLGRLLRSLGVSGLAIPEDTDERATMYRSLLADKRVLVVLDGVIREHEIEPLLPGSAGCAVILTSRERLDGLPGLVSIDLDVFEPGTAVELLGKAAGFDRIDAEPVAAAELVRFCDGLPLALRIAGARLAGKRHWPVQELVARLTSDVRRLDELSHHGQELRSTIDLSYQGLGTREQRLFRLCALVPTPDFPAWTAAALLDTEVATGTDLLETLVDTQLLTVVAYPNQRPRYRFHDLIRVYANEQLTNAEPADNQQAALERMLGGWMAFVEEAHRSSTACDCTTLHGTAPRWRPPDVSLAELIGSDQYQWLDRERSAVVAAIRQAADSGLDEMCWNLVFSSVTLFELGHFDDWRESVEVGLRAVEQAGNRLGHATMLHAFGAMYSAQARPADVFRYAPRSEQEFRAIGDDHGLALSIRQQATAAGLRGDDEFAIRRFREAAKLFRAVGAEMRYAHTQRKLAAFEIAAGNFDTARSMLVEALSIVRKGKDVRSEAMVLTRIGELDSQAGDFDGALASLRAALGVVREIGDRVGETFVLYGIGSAEHRKGRLTEARTNLHAAVDVAERVGQSNILANAMRELGEIATKTGDPATAVEHLDNAQRRYAELGAIHRQAEALSLLEEIRARMAMDESGER